MQHTPQYLRVIGRMYPESFRERYGEGFYTLMSEEKVTPRTVVDLVAGAVDAHLVERSTSDNGVRFDPGRILGRTLLGALYGLIAMPLAIAYLVFLAVGLGFGIGTAVTLVGLPVLALTFAAARQFGRFERWLTSTLLDVDLGASRATPLDDLHVIEIKDGKVSLLLGKLKALLLSAESWRSLVYLALKVPFSVASFGVIVMLLSSAFIMLTMPIAYSLFDIEAAEYGQWLHVESMFQAVLASIGGVFTLLAAAVVINVLALVWREIARFLLAQPGQTATLPPTVEAA